MEISKKHVKNIYHIINILGFISMIILLYMDLYIYAFIVFVFATWDFNDYIEIIKNKNTHGTLYI